MRGHGRRALPLFALWFGLAAVTRGDWVDQVFPERSFDFGTVARGSRVVHAFRVVNSTKQTVRIASYTAKCGCTAVHIGAKEIPPGTQTRVEMTLDTTKFEGPKSSGITLQLDRPELKTVELDVRSVIRSDLTITPGLVEFGGVLRSSHPRTSLMLNYAGSDPSFQITGMKTISAALKAELKPLGRTTTGALAYQLTADLDPQGLRDGRFKDEITLQTTDPRMPNVPVSVAARIQSAVSLTPAVLDLKDVPSGVSKEWTTLVKGATPFRLTGAKLVQGEAALPTITDEAKALHVLKFRFTAPAEAGPAHIVVELQTDVANEPPLRLTVFANVVAASATSGASAPPASSD